MVNEWTEYCARPVYLYVALSVWTPLWALIGYRIGRSDRKRARYVIRLPEPSIEGDESVNPDKKSG